MPTQRAKVEVYAIKGCPFCIATKDLLRDLGVRFEEHDLSGRADRREVTAAILPGHSSVPLVLIDGEPIGGNDALQAMHARGELVPALFGADEG
ncbi:MAG: glutaredoxin [Planctomycetota bacterium]